MGCHENDDPILTGRDLFYESPGDFSVVKCRKCSLMRTTPRPDPASMGFYYPENYGPYKTSQIQSENKHRNAFEKLIIFLTQSLKLNSECLPVMVPGRLLEIGCASGSFLHKMQKQGWRTQGIELSEKAAQSARSHGLNVHVGTLENAPSPEESFDLIVGWFVLEHLHQPIDCLKKLREWATAESWLVLSIPNAGSFEFQIFRERWYALHLPFHLHHFTPKTINEVLKVSGWSLKKIYHHRTLSNLIASFGYYLIDKGWEKTGRKLIAFPQKANIAQVAFLYPLAYLFSLFGQTGRMTVWAKPTP